MCEEESDERGPGARHAAARPLLGKLMNSADRLRAAALSERLTLPKATFDPAGARELIDLVPLNRRAGLVSVQARIRGIWPPIGGVPAGGGGAPSWGGEEERRYAIGEEVAWRCGAFKIEHRPGRLVIRQLFDDAHDDASGRRCRLVYSLAARTPRRLDLLQQYTVPVGPVRLAFSWFRPWKRPA